MRGCVAGWRATIYFRDNPPFPVDPPRRASVKDIGDDERRKDETRRLQRAPGPACLYLTTTDPPRWPVTRSPTAVILYCHDDSRGFSVRRFRVFVGLVDVVIMNLFHRPVIVVAGAFISMTDTSDATNRRSGADIYLSLASKKKEKKKRKKKPKKIVRFTDNRFTR